VSPRVGHRGPASHRTDATRSERVDVDAQGAPAWASATFDPPSYGQRQPERTAARWRLRQLRRQVSVLKRGRECGTPLGRSDVVLKVTPTGEGYASGIVTCGSVWACPVCAAKIRAHRADEIARGLSRLIDEMGGGALLVTLTLPHTAGDRLARTLALVSEGWQAVASGRPWRRERDDYGVLGQIRALEITHGAHGWHPHLHLIVALDRPATVRMAAELAAAWQTRWDAWLLRQGWRASATGVGVDVRPVRGAAEIAQYVAKVQEGSKLAPTSAASELARGDLKATRAAGSRTPFAILADFGSAGTADDLDLWHEYERATQGRSAIRWSPGLRDRLLPDDDDEMTDDDIAAAEQDGESVARLDRELYRALCAIPGAEYGVVSAATRGYRAVLIYVTELGLDHGGVSRPPADDG